MGQFAVALVSGGLGYVLADGIDRLLATYDPAATGERPKDKFTSDGAGTLANTLNIASAPGLVRIAAGVGLTAVPAIAAAYVDGPYTRASLEGAALGAGISLFKTLWNGFLMPMLKPKDTSAAALQKSYIARLYPAEIAAAINREQKQTAVSSAGSGALSGAEAPKDVGPFALSGESPYPDAAQALRSEAGMQGPGGDFPTLQNVWGTGDFPTAAQAMYRETGQIGADVFSKLATALPGVHPSHIQAAARQVLTCVPTAGVSAPPSGDPGQPGVSAWQPGPPPLPGPGPEAAPGEDPACGCMGDGEEYGGFIGDEPEKDSLFSTAAE